METMDLVLHTHVMLRFVEARLKHRTPWSLENKTKQRNKQKTRELLIVIYTPGTYHNLHIQGCIGLRTPSGPPNPICIKISPD